MIQKMLDQASDKEDEGMEGDASDDDDEESDEGPHQIKMRFDSASRDAQAKKQDKSKKGIMALKFMERAQEKEKQALKAEVNLAVKQIKGEDDYAESDDENSSADGDKGKTFIDSANKFGVKGLRTKTTASNPIGKELDAEQVLKAARRVTGNANSSDDDSDASNDNELDQHKTQVKQARAKASINQQQTPANDKKLTSSKK